MKEELKLYHEEDLYPNRKYKDTLFRMIFSEPRALLELYNAINKTHYENPEDLEITMVESAVYMSMEHDVSLIIDDCVQIYEHQSTDNPNMVLRGLFYIAAIYRSYIRKTKQNLFGSRLVKIPNPRYIIFYNGVKKKAEYTELKLSDSYYRSGENRSLEFKAIMININEGSNHELMEQCTKLKEYAYLVACVRKYREQTGDMVKAVSLAVEDCIEKNCLKEILLKNREVVCEMMLFEYENETYVDYEKQYAREEGKAEGKAEGMQQGLETGEKRMQLLMENLLRDERMEDLKRAVGDYTFCRQLFEEYGIKVNGEN